MSDDPLREISAKLSTVDSRLKEVGKWLRFQNLPQLRKILVDELDSDPKKLAYEMTDGQRGRRDIAAKLQLSNSTIRGWWERWFNLGILQPSETRKGTPQKIVDLDDVGIEVSKPEPKEEVT